MKDIGAGGTDEVLRYLPDELQRAAVDIALVHLGTNDLFRGDSIDSTLNELQDVIGLLRRGNPHVAVLVANLIPTNFAATP